MLGLKETIKQQREMLSSLLGSRMDKLAQQCCPIIHNRNLLEQRLQKALPKLQFCKHLYVLDVKGVQLTANVTATGIDVSHFGRDRMKRPYMLNIIGSTNFKLSEAYISRNAKRPSLTAIQVIRDHENRHIGFLGADFDLREIPGSEGLYNEPSVWRQIKGDPAIRGGLFLQRRAHSLMDDNIDNVLSLMAELIREYGVFHGKLHFSSSRATVWLMDNPYEYRLLSIDDLTDPDICFAYPHRPYTSKAVVPQDKLGSILSIFKELRFADENIYLRAGSINVINGLVSLNFSCDGSHYLPWNEFLGKNIGFWFGTLS